ncbi:DUF935 domain-containing protein [Shewanella yunxiaonensis]|uniref:DUF935 domain-containing protein n=1 Tax=Shewanella yunxiaonensis TaxID=2829809 RepID=A0ABX7YVS5_9GAMM|nr:DUF935 domain-containing protein [Shewanella yunxiaonensis]QUN06440.1 DUF935 domain-containing protein [Shewanella yunxiaonensis]
MATPAEIKARLGRNNSALKELQTDRAQVGYVSREWDTHPTSGLNPARLAEIMLNAEQGYLVDQFDLADDIEEKDAHIMAEIQKRKNALLGKQWQIVAPKNASAAEQRDADMVTDIINSLPDFEDLILDMGDGILRAISNSQIHWENEGNIWYPGKFESIPARRFETNDDDRNKVLLRLDGGQTEALWPLGWIQHTHKAKSGYIARAGLIRVLAWPFLFKNYSVRDLAEFLEIYGLPLRLGKYPSGATKDEKSTLLQAVMSIGHNAGGIIPTGMQIDFEEAAKGGEGPYMAMVSWAERSASKAILGGTLTSQADGKSSTNALGNVHDEVRQELLASDLRQIASTLTRDLVWPLVMLNGSTFSNMRRRPRLVFDTQDPEDLKTYSEAIPALVNIGMKISNQWVADKLKIPVPKDDELVLGVQQLPATAPNADAAQSQPTATPGAGTDSVQQTALNGAQITSLSEIIQQYTAGELDKDAAQALIKAGFPAIPDNLINQMLSGKQRQSQLPATKPDPTAAALRAIVALKQAAPKSADIDPLTQALAVAAGQQLDDDISAISKAVNEATSWDDVEKALITSFSDRGAVALSAIMQQAMAAAALAGRYDVELGN